MLSVEWCCQIASRLCPSHAFPVGCSGNSMPLCGRGVIRRCSRPVTDANNRRRKNQIQKCVGCQIMILGGQKENVDA